ncbi:DnaJ-domain-containing protein [Aspergillus sclerotioniger CBS 115572]|uniref:DnaJ-domain-containing protein n=1 Tax=Aspergillus sclerotioniger CBS 115572 TaxID=1450535 RepID=A0A317XGU3_9EURO|nr:DnaJ-domain-containing protein [Aspergillus sclerotioniger CBS 115572]PWY96598.1 DnaJ-domain-containing protein [Aspergillus sclerotioniger CBS 115572]
MSSTPDINPYEVLGVPKDAILADIKSAHRKLVLKWHPDKVKVNDESLRNKAQDEFQRVQQAYEILSDETKRQKYDAKARLAELRREAQAQGVSVNIGGASPYPRASGSSGAREFRNGRIYEERTPADAPYFDEDLQFSEGSRSTSRKYDEFGKRPTKPSDEKKKTKGDTPSARAAKDMARDSPKTTHTSRAKYRTKERRREAFEKYDRAVPASSVYVRIKRPSEKRNRDSSSRKARPTESSRRREPARYDNDEYTDEYESKHDKLHTTARDYIMRSKGTVPIEIDSRPQGSRSPPRRHNYESADRESSSSRHSDRSKRPSKESVRTTSSRSGSYEKLETTARSYETKVPSMPTAATSPAAKLPPSVRPSLQPSRSASSAQSHSRPKGISRSDSLGPMVYELSSRAAKLRGTDKYDSGYSSPSTPEMASGEIPSKSTRYKILTNPDMVVVEPSIPPPQKSPRHARGYSPPRQERPASGRPMPKPPVRSSTYAYPTEHSPRYEPAPRPSASRQSSSRPLYREVSSPKEKEFRYAREVGPEHIPSRDPHIRQSYGDYAMPPLERRQSAFAR